MKVYLFLVAEK